MDLRLLFTLFALCWVKIGGSDTLHIGVLLEKTNYWYSPFARTFEYVFNYVFKEIKNTTGILDGFDFQLHIRNTMGDSGLAACELLSLINDGQPKVAIFGPTSSSALALTGEITPVFKLMQFSFVADTASTANKSVYSTLIKVNQASDMTNPLRIKMMRYFKWTRVGTIAEQNDIFVSQIEDFIELAPEYNLTVVTSAVFTVSNQFEAILSSFKRFDVRIIMVSAYGRHTADMFCAAYKQGMYGKDYAWIWPGTFSREGWMGRNFNTDCLREEVIEAAVGHFTVHTLLMSYSNDSTVSGMSAGDEIEVVTNVLRANSQTIISRSLPMVIDTAWSLAIGLNNSLKYLAEKGISLHNYTYSDDFISSFMMGMKDVSFLGVSGPISFDEDWNRLGMTYIRQHFEEESITIAYYDMTTDDLMLMVDPSSIWTDGIVPADQMSISHTVISTSSTWVIGVGILNGLGCLASICFLIFNNYYRNNWSVMMSSPSLNNGIISGCMLMYAEVFIDLVTGISPTRTFCMSKVWLVCTAFTLVFGSLFAKTYRVYVIFRKNSQPNKFLTDNALYKRIIFMLLVDCIILVPWTIVDPLTTRRLVLSTKDIDDLNVMYSDEYFFCDDDNKGPWIAAIYVYKGLLLIFGLFLAWETRTVSLEEINDSKAIGACIYNVVIFCILGVPLAHVLDFTQTALKFVLEALLMLTCTTIIQCIIFVPKIRDRNKVPNKALKTITQDGNEKSMLPSDIFELSMTKPSNSTAIKQRGKSGRTKAKNLDDTKSSLEEENKSLRTKLAKEIKAITNLKKSLLEMTSDTYFYRSGDQYVVVKTQDATTLPVQTEDI